MLKPEHVFGPVGKARTYYHRFATFGNCPNCFQAGPMMAVCGECTSYEDRDNPRKWELFSRILIGEKETIAPLWLAEQVGAPVLWPYADRIVVYIKDHDFNWRCVAGGPRYLGSKLLRAWKKWNRKKGGGEKSLTMEAQKVHYFYQIGLNPDTTEETFDEGKDE